MLANLNKDMIHHSFFDILPTIFTIFMQIFPYNSIKVYLYDQKS